MAASRRTSPERYGVSASTPRGTPNRCRRSVTVYECTDSPPDPYVEQIAIKTGVPAPAFVARVIADGRRQGIVTLDDYLNKTCLVVFFCPVDLTSVVPLEVLAFSDHAHRFRNQGCEVVVLSTDSEIRLRTLTGTPRQKGGLGSLNVVLAMDKGGKIAREYGSVNSHGDPIRGVFLLNSAGVICRSACDTLPVGWPVVEETLRLLETAFGRDLKIAVNKPFRACTFIDVKSSETVEGLQRKVGCTTKGWCALFYNGKRLKDGASLASSGVQNGAAVTIVETSDVMICVAFPPPNGVDVVWSPLTEKVECFKRMLERLRGFPVADQRLFFGGREMCDSTKTLGDYGLAKENLIQVTLVRGMSACVKIQ